MNKTLFALLVLLISTPTYAGPNRDALESLDINKDTIAGALLAAETLACAQVVETMKKQGVPEVVSGLDNHSKAWQNASYPVVDESGVNDIVESFESDPKYQALLMITFKNFMDTAVGEDWLKQVNDIGLDEGVIEANRLQDKKIDEWWREFSNSKRAVVECIDTLPQNSREANKRYKNWRKVADRLLDAADDPDARAGLNAYLLQQESVLSTAFAEVFVNAAPEILATQAEERRVLEEMREPEVPLAREPKKPVEVTPGGLENDLRLQYVTTIAAVVTDNWLRPETAQAGLRCTVRVVQIPGGEVISSSLVGPCNGDEETRRSILAAVDRSGVLPYRGFESVFSREIELVFTYDGSDADRKSVEPKKKDAEPNIDAESNKIVWSCTQPGGDEPALWLVEWGNQSYVKVFDEKIPADYSMRGLDKHWAWGGVNTTYDFAITLNPGLTANYYDFSTSVDGNTPSSGLYYCEK